MKAKTLSLFMLIAILALTIHEPVKAQAPEPWFYHPPKLREPQIIHLGLPSDGFCQTPGGLWAVLSNTHQTVEAPDVSTQATGGPDEFGYTWSDTVPLSWIDATNGIDTGMSGDSWGQRVGPIPLPFPFKYYENIYNSLYIAASGYIAFTDEGTWPRQPRIPSPAKPNNVIAPYATPLYIGSGSWVRYLSGGNSPNRYFVVEWHDVKGGPPSDTIGNDETYRFEVILYENGDIVFQYQTMSYNDSYWCGAAGIEDSTGMDGLNYVPFCQRAPSNKAVRFYRPAPSARVKVYPLYQGRFSRSGTIETFQVPIRNTGDLGSDTYDLLLSSSWMTGLYKADGVTPLTDTDGDSIIDTGPVSQGGTVTITVKVQIPAVVNVGDYTTTNITVRSSLNINKSKTAGLQVAIPAPFAQVYRDDADGAMSLYLVQPSGQSVRKVTGDQYYGYDMAVAETPNGFAYFWIRYNWTGTVGTSEIEYTLLNRYGQTIRGVSKLTDHRGATVHTYDYYPAVAVTPSGRIGVVWYRYLYNSSNFYWNYNIYYAILDAAGNIIVPPTNLTNNNIWGYG